MGIQYEKEETEAKLPSPPVKTDLGYVLDLICPCCPFRFLLLELLWSELHRQRFQSMFQ